MNRAFIFALLTVFVSACSSEEVVEDVPDDEVITNEKISEEEEEEIEDKSYLFVSDGEGVKEFMKCTKLEDGTNDWVYFTAKNEKEIKLGSRQEAGFEVVYFQAKPKELYWVYGAECGFTLSDDTRKTSQWYGQIQPRCADDMF